MRRWRPHPFSLLIVGVLMSGAAFVSGFGGALTGDDSGGQAVSSSQLLALEANAPPAITARAAVVEDGQTGQVIFAKHEHAQLPMASTTKLMTALLTIEHGDLSQRITAGQDAATIGGSSMGLRAGERMSMTNLLYGLLLPSGNDAAVALADAIAGSPAAFVRLMNQRAATLGLRDTKYINVNGYDDPAQHTSVADLVSLARLDMSQPLFAQIVATRVYTIPATASHLRHVLVNLNALLGVYAGDNGVKTGTTPLAGQCLVSSVVRSGHWVLAAELGSSARYRDMTALLNQAFDGGAWAVPPPPSGDLARIALPGASINAWPGLSADPAAPVWLPAWEASSLRCTIDLQAVLDVSVMTVAPRESCSLFGQVVMVIPLKVR